MKQVIQSLRSGTMELIESPKPVIRPGHVLIQTYASIISKGTEESLIRFGQASWIKKAQLQPDKVAMVRAKLKSDGIRATLSSVRNKLERPVTLGYSQSGVVVAVGEGVTDFSIGDRVTSNGPHAEFVCVPHSLCVKLPSSGHISFEEAAFTPIASIALQGIRLLNPTLGEYVVVQGLGIIGLITVQLLKAQGCQVLGIDFDGPRLELAKQFGAEIHSLTQNPNPIPRAMFFSKGQGVDGVIVTASTDSSEPIHLAAEMSRKRGKIVLVGSTGTQLSRDDFYKKELTFQVSCSYGPGRYEKNYEQNGMDYPIGFVRWTEKRNMEAVLNLLVEKKLNLVPLISHRVPFASSIDAYELISSKQYTNAIVLSYPVACNQIVKTSVPHLFPISYEANGNRLGIVGAGEHTTKVILPKIKKQSVSLIGICSQSGVNATLAARKHKIPITYSDSSQLINSSQIDIVMILSQHDSHAELVKESIRANKHIFVEKPLATTIQQIDEIEKLVIDSRFSKALWVGYNRRYSPLSQKLKTLLDGTNGPKQMIYTVNALPLPATHWTQDPLKGGGRVVSEIGHFLDLLRFLATAPFVEYSVSGISSELSDHKNSLSISLKFADGSIGTLNYSTMGNRSYPKERLEIFVDNKIAVLENFKTLRGYGFKNFSKMSLWSQDKGHDACLAQFFNSVKQSPFDVVRWSEVLEISRLACQIQALSHNDSIQTTKVI